MSEVIISGKTRITIQTSQIRSKEEADKILKKLGIEPRNEKKEKTA